MECESISPILKLNNHKKSFIHYIFRTKPNLMLILTHKVTKPLILGRLRHSLGHIRTVFVSSLIDNYIFRTKPNLMLILIQKVTKPLILG